MENVVLKNTGILDDIAVGPGFMVYGTLTTSTMSLTSLLIKHNMVLSMNHNTSFVNFSNDFTSYVFTGEKLDDATKSAISIELNVITEIAKDIKSVEDVSYMESEADIDMPDYLGTKYLIMGALDGEFEPEEI